MAETFIVQGEGITLDLLLWRKYGVSGQALLEQTFKLNHGLGALGYILPLGTVVKLPEPPTATESKKIVDLFGD